MDYRNQNVKVQDNLKTLTSDIPSVRLMDDALTAKQKAKQKGEPLDPKRAFELEQMA